MYCRSYLFKNTSSPLVSPSTQSKSYLNKKTPNLMKLCVLALSPAPIFCYAHATRRTDGRTDESTKNRAWYPLQG